MLEALEYYQSLAQKFQSQLLTGPGIIVVLTGLCIWLAGLRWRRVIGAFTGAAVAAIGVFLIGNFAANVVLTACIIGILAGIVINRIVFGIFGAAVGVLVIMVILAGGPAAAEVTADNFVSDYSCPTWPEYEQSDAGLDASAASQITTQMAEYFADRAKKAITSASAVSFAAAGVVIVIAAIATLMAPRLFIAAVSSTLGSAVIFAGMIMLLFYKGSKPISCIAEKPRFYLAAFTAMIIFGTLVQLVLSPPAKAKAKADEETKGEKK
jgi:hypothetical protein